MELDLGPQLQGEPLASAVGNNSRVPEVLRQTIRSLAAHRATQVSLIDSVSTGACA